MKRLMLMLFMLVLILGVAQAVDEKVILDDWVRYDHSFSFEGINYSISTLNTGDMNHQELGRIAIRGSNGTEILDFGECVENELYKYCFLNTTFSGDKIDIDSQGQAQPGLKIKMIEYKYIPDFKYTRNFVRTSFKLYEKGDVSFFLENTGDQIIGNITIYEKIPEGFSASPKSTNVRVENKNIVMAGPLNLYPGKTWSGGYTIKAMNYTEGSYKTIIHYNTETENNKTKEGTSTTLKVPEPLTVTTTKFKNTFDSTSKIEFVITIKNNEDEVAHVDNFKVYAPLNMYASTTNNLEKNINNRFSFSGEIEPGETKSFNVILKPLYSGRYSINYYFEVELKKQQHKFSGREKFQVETKEMSCYFTVEETEIQAGNPLVYNVSIENDDNENYYDITGTVENPLSETITINKSNIDQGKIYTTNTQRIMLPISENDKEINLSMNVKYRSDDQEWFECKSSLPILIKGGTKFLDAKINTDKKVIVPGDEVEINISIENLVEQEFSNVYIEHEILGNLSSEGFSRKSLNKIEGKEMVEAYSIKVNIPKDYNKDFLKISLTYGSEKPFYEDGTIIQIPIEINKTTTTTNSNSDSTTTDKKTTKKKVEYSDDMNFVDKAIAFLTNLFGGNK